MVSLNLLEFQIGPPGLQPRCLILTTPSPTWFSYYKVLVDHYYECIKDILPFCLHASVHVVVYNSDNFCSFFENLHYRIF